MGAVELACKKGTFLQSGHLDRYCLPSGEWSGVEPVCQGKFELSHTPMFVELLNSFVLVLQMFVLALQIFMLALSMLALPMLAFLAMNNKLFTHIIIR